MNNTKFLETDVALISVDNTKTFEDKNLNELYVEWWEQAAKRTKKMVDYCNERWIMTINVLEKHPKGHISFASSFEWKNPLDTINYDEVKSWNETTNGLSESAWFTLNELKAYLKKEWEVMLRPDHAKDRTESSDLMEPLEEKDFDLTIVKWDAVDAHPYSWFEETQLDNELKKRKKKTIIVTWVATDYCSGQTALDGKELDYDVYLVKEAIRWVSPETTDAMIKKLTTKKVKIVSADDIFELFAKKIAS